VRHYLFEEGHEVETLAKAALQSPGKVVGQLTCICKATDSWALAVGADQGWGLAICGCNGSTLPLYIGAPRSGPASARPCRSNCRTSLGRMGIGIGYPGAVPAVGTVDAERAVEIVVISHCKTCGKSWTAWTLRLPEPPLIQGNESWLRRIQGLR
jgi:hypothetical protein